MRHAQEYWLRLQANEALSNAMERDQAVFPTENWIRAKAIEGNKPRLMAAMKKERSSLLVSAADQLVRAEILHREIVRRGGQP